MLRARVGNPAYAGGHCGITHVDIGALAWLHTLGCRSLLDVGCGPGGQVAAARALGWRAIGIDVDLSLYGRAGVALCDLAITPVILPATADVVWSVEVAEHIPPEYIPHYITTLAANTGRVLVMTASQMTGPLHVSVHPPQWWSDQLRAAGMIERMDLRDDLLRHSTMQREFLRETGMVYVHAERQGRDESGGEKLPADQDAPADSDT